MAWRRRFQQKGLGHHLLLIIIIVGNNTTIAGRGYGIWDSDFIKELASSGNPLGFTVSVRFGLASGLEHQLRRRPLIGAHTYPSARATRRLLIRSRGVITPFSVTCLRSSSAGCPSQLFNLFKTRAWFSAMSSINKHRSVSRTDHIIRLAKDDISFFGWRPITFAIAINGS
jgi:hypothetical protein